MLITDRQKSLDCVGAVEVVTTHGVCGITAHGRREVTRTVHIIANCTDRKRLPVPAELRLRAVRPGTPSDRGTRWWNRLRDHQSPVVQATDLYVGDHWAVTKTLPEIARASGLRPSLWVASAGYGLVPSNAPLRSYSATFAAGHADSVSLSRNGASGSEFTREWWAHLSGIPGPLRGLPRTVTDIVRDDPRACVLVVASPDYVSAMEDDLLAAARESKQPDGLLIISGRGRFAAGPLGTHLIPSEARLQLRLGGARLSLHARVARRILEEAPEWKLSAEILQARYRRIVARSPDLPHLVRQKMTDEEVQRFIRAQIRKSPAASCTPLLRLLRDSGRACEQSRFKALFNQERRTHAS